MGTKKMAVVVMAAVLSLPILAWAHGGGAGNPRTAAQALAQCRKDRHGWYDVGARVAKQAHEFADQFQQDAGPFKALPALEGLPDGASLDECVASRHAIYLIAHSIGKAAYQMANGLCPGLSDEMPDSDIEQFLDACKTRLEKAAALGSGSL